VTKEPPRFARSSKTPIEHCVQEEKKRLKFRGRVVRKTAGQWKAINIVKLKKPCGCGNGGRYFEVIKGGGEKRELRI